VPENGNVPENGSRGWKIPEGVKCVSGWNELPADFGGPEKKWFRNETGELYVNCELEGKGYFTVNTPKTKIFTGFVAGRTFDMGDITIQPGKTRLDWCTFSMTDADEKRTLIALTGFFRNTGQEFENLGQDKITCRANWGTTPTLCEGVPMEVKIRGGKASWKCYALAPDGSRRVEVPIRATEEGIIFTLSPEYKTIWYELVRAN
ncbi:MAG: hypothetical protein Q4C70_01165, partial [Planctomycetia bacterium]|nr:hypothetical protein [Planctomycetia bacterium]